GLAERKIDALLVSFGPNLRYLSGFTGSSGALLVLPERTILFTDPRYTIQSHQESTCEIKISKRPITEDILAVIEKRKLKRIGFEPGRMSFEVHDKLKSKLPMRASLVPISGWIEELRCVKSPTEIARIRRSVETNSRAFEQAARRVKPGMREHDLAAELDYQLRRLGAEKNSFETIVAAGLRSALPHAQPTA